MYSKVVITSSNIPIIYKYMLVYHVPISFIKIGKKHVVNLWSIPSSSTNPSTEAIYATQSICLWMKYCMHG